MTDRYERDKDGNIVGRVLNTPVEETGPTSAPNNNSRQPDTASANSTLASRARGEKPKPMPSTSPYANSTLAERAKANAKRQQGAESKQVASAQTEDKSAKPARKG